MANQPEVKTGTVFTPGPWRIRNGYLEAAADSESIVHSIEPSWIPDAWTGHELADANARLIAAAPELYSVLDEIVTSLETTLGNRLCAKALTALAKARGEAP